ncbi:MAG: hypothetical protein EHM36_11285 [Deltaproteobacteria bacterium]|jgi:hypothetical protein|nr:MAG: hypothetical protein EHM36_11285 [Deltaproteobacteria bacterium]
MKPLATVLDPERAWALWHELAKFCLLLWDWYEEDFAKLAKEAKEERIRMGLESEEDLEVPF